MNCSYCGHSFETGPRFCPSCGRPVQNQAQAPDEFDEFEQSEITEASPDEAESRRAGRPRHARQQSLQPEADKIPDIYDEYDENVGEPQGTPERSERKRIAPEPRRRRLDDELEDQEYYDELDMDDPIEKLKTRSKSAYSNVSKRVATYSLQGWQQMTIGIVAGAALCFLIATLAGTGQGILGLLGCGLMVLFMLRKPKFDALQMVLPLTAFAMMYGVIGIQNSYGSIGYGGFSANSLMSIIGSGLSFLGLGSYSLTDSSIFDFLVRVLIYAMPIVYFLMLIGKMKDVGVTCYYMLGACGVAIIYSLIWFFRYFRYGLIIPLYALGCGAFASAYMLFIINAPKPKMKKGKKTNKNAAYFNRLLAVVPSEYSDYDFSEYHPYYTLGGFLKAIYIMLYIGAVMVVLSGVISLFSIAVMLWAGGLLGVSLIKISFVLLLFIAFMALIAYLMIKLAKKIKVRDETFLQLYHITIISSMAASFMIECATQGLWGAIGSLIGMLIGAVLGTMYFRKSVRVRSYMLSDEYLRLSVFTRNAPDPKPVD